MFKLMVILSEIEAVNNDAACCIPARKLAGAAIAAASNKRLMVMPPDVAATTVVTPPCALWAWVASLVRTEISRGAAMRGFAPSLAAEGSPPMFETEALLPATEDR